MKYLLSAAALSAAAAVIGIASANQAHQPPQPPSAASIEADRAQVRRAKAAAQVCGGSAWEMHGAVLTCHKEIKQ